MSDWAFWLANAWNSSQNTETESSRVLSATGHRGVPGMIRRAYPSYIGYSQQSIGGIL